MTSTKEQAQAALEAVERAFNEFREMENIANSYEDGHKITTCLSKDTDISSCNAAIEIIRKYISALEAMAGEYIIDWGEERSPDYNCPYTHCVARTPLGEIRIEWKGWKDQKSFVTQMPWGEFICAISLDDIKENIQNAWDRKIKECTQPTKEQDDE